MASAKYKFSIAVEAVIELRKYIISLKDFRAPEDYIDEAIVFCFWFTVEKADKVRQQTYYELPKLTLHVLADADPMRKFS